MSKHLRNERGQSITETVVFLPVLLLLFLGITYLKELTDARTRAIEAARYATWEGVWYVRGKFRSGDANSGKIKTTSELKAELNKIGLGRNLVDVRASMSEDLNGFVKKFDTGTSGFSPALGYLPFTNLKVGAAPVAGSIPSELAGIASQFGSLAYGVNDFIASKTRWDTEANKTIYTARVDYGFKGAGFFKAMPKIDIIESSSIVSHSYNLERDDPRPKSGENQNEAERRANQVEYDEMFGPAGEFSCTSGTGHIFDLWLVPSGPGGGEIGAIVGGIGTAVKCVVVGLGDVLKAIPLGSLGFKQPDGTLKSYSETEIKD